MENLCGLCYYNDPHFLWDTITAIPLYSSNQRSFVYKVFSEWQATLCEYDAVGGFTASTDIGQI